MAFSYDEINNGFMHIVQAPSVSKLLCFLCL